MRQRRHEINNARIVDGDKQMFHDTSEALISPGDQVEPTASSDQLFWPDTFTHRPFSLSL